MDAAGAAIEGLVCEGVTVSPGQGEVLHELSFEVPASSRTVIVGPSGSGKTTLLRAICGLEQLDRGRIELGGRQIDGLPAHQRRCAVVFQEPRLLPHLDVLDNVAIGLVASRVPRKARRARARELVEEVGLEERADGGVNGLSGGERQRTALARALCAEPELLLLDEPLSAVDPNRRASLMELLLDLQRRREVTTLAVTHDRAEAAELGESIALLVDGRIVQSDQPQVLFQRPESEEAARFFGMNVIHGQVHGGFLEVEGSLLAVGGPDGAATFAIRPESVEIGSAGQLQMTVSEAVFLGSHVRLRLKGGETAIEAQVPVGDSPAAGSRVGVLLPETVLWRIPRS